MKLHQNQKSYFANTQQITNISLYLHGIAWYMLGQYCPLSLFSQTRTVLQKKTHNTHVRKNEKITMNENKVVTMNAQDLPQN